MPKQSLPKRLYVKRVTEDDTDATWIVAAETTETMEHGDLIGIYELRETKTLKITRDLQ